MPKAQTLREVKRVEEEVAKLRSDAAADRERILKEARDKAAEIVQAAEADGDSRYQDHLEQVRHEVESERARILEKGEEGAEATRSAASGERLDEAASLVVERFQKRILE